MDIKTLIGEATEYDKRNRKVGVKVSALLLMV